jgi:hypothetical protein
MEVEEKCAARKFERSSYFLLAVTKSLSMYYLTSKISGPDKTDSAMLDKESFECEDAILLHCCLQLQVTKLPERVLILGEL